MNRKVSIAAIALALCGCNVQEMTDIRQKAEENAKEGITATVPDFEIVETRTSLSQEGSNPPSFAWKEGDVMGIVPADSATYQTNYKVREVGENPHHAVFDGGAWALKPGHSYIAYYPCATKALTSADKVELCVEGQKQSGNNSLEYLGDFDYLYAEEEGAVNGNVNFSFKHKICLVRFTLTAEDSYTLNKATLETENGDIVTNAEMSIADGEVKAVEKEKSLDIALEDLSVSKGEEIAIWMALLPSDGLNGKSIKLTLTDAKGKKHVFGCGNGFTLEAGKAYSVKAEKPIASETAMLTYDEARGKYTYGNESTYTNDSGEWIICVYSDGTDGSAFQLNNGKVAYIGTPELAGAITEITIKTVKSFSGNFLLCSDKGSTSASGIICTIKGQGMTTTASTNELPEGRIWIRTSSVANISSIELTAEGSGAGEAEDTPFTRLSAPGFYSATDSDAPALDKGTDGPDTQYSFATVSDGRMFRIIDIQEGNMSELHILSNSTKTGNEVTIAESHMGEGASSAEAKVKIVKKDGKKLWLENKTDHKGYIIEIQ